MNHDNDESERAHSPESDPVDRAWPRSPDDGSNIADQEPAPRNGQGRPGGAAAVQRQQSGDSPHAASVEPSEEEARVIVERLELLAQRFESQQLWSAPLAHHSDMVEYQKLVPDAPERIFRMAEAQTVDRSRRQDRLTDAEIANAKSDRSTATFFLLAFFMASIVFFALGNPIAGGCLLSIPVLGIVKTMWPSRSNDSE